MRARRRGMQAVSVEEHSPLPKSDLVSPSATRGNALSGEALTALRQRRAHRKSSEGLWRYSSRAIALAPVDFVKVPEPVAAVADRSY